MRTSKGYELSHISQKIMQIRRGKGRKRLDPHHEDVFVDAHCSAFEDLEHFQSVLIVLFGDVCVWALRVERLLVLYLLLVLLVTAIHVLVWINTLAHNQPHHFCLKTA